MYYILISFLETLAGTSWSLAIEVALVMITLSTAVCTIWFVQRRIRDLYKILHDVKVMPTSLDHDGNDVNLLDENVGETGDSRTRVTGGTGGTGGGLSGYKLGGTSDVEASAITGGGPSGYQVVKTKPTAINQITP